ncbi:hypothetical protein Mapa_003962 [Marchantia paleacea]|nr:hypothetical protein Mapa_003962 [Marchantia paleacea]
MPLRLFQSIEMPATAIPARTIVLPHTLATLCSFAEAPETPQCTRLLPSRSPMKQKLQNQRFTFLTPFPLPFPSFTTALRTYRTSHDMYIQRNLCPGSTLGLQPDSRERCPDTTPGQISPLWKSAEWSYAIRRKSMMPLGRSYQ